jgi:hypothetical protein
LVRPLPLPWEKELECALARAAAHILPEEYERSKKNLLSPNLEEAQDCCQEIAEQGN